MANLPMLLLSAALGIVMVLDGIPLLGILIPADAAIMIAIAVKGPLSGIPVVVAVLVGYLTTASFGFFVGRRFGYQVRTSALGSRIGERRWDMGERILTDQGTRMLIFTPFLPFISTLVPLIAGILRVPYRKFLPSIALGSISWTCLYVLLGTCASTISRLLPGGSLTTMSSVAVGLVLSTVVVQRIHSVVRVTPAGS